MEVLTPLTATETARIVKTRPETVLRWLESGQLPAYRSGRVWKILPADLGAFLRERSQREAEARQRASEKTSTVSSVGAVG